MGMRTKVGALALLAGLAIAVTGCGGQTQTTASDGDALTGRTFVSTKVTEGGKPRALAPGTVITVQFTDDGRLIANAGCNTMQSPVDTGDGKLAMPDLAITEMGCDQPRHDQDTWLADLLQAEPSWRLDADNLFVTSGKTELVLLDKEVATPDRALEGTKWLVTTYYDGEVARNQPASGDDAPYLTFADGKVTGSGGCNRLSGKATVDGETITFEPIVTTKMACADKGRNTDETHILNVLKGRVSFEIDADALTLSNPEGYGIGLVAK